MKRHVEKLAILFADVNGSTALYEKQGDQVARAIIARCMAIMIAAVNARHGRVIKTIGDGMMCTFPTAEAAFHAACEMQYAIENERPGGATPIHIHVGFHYGEALHEHNDIFGDAVNIASRIADLTRTREIMTTRATVEVLPPELRDKTRQMFRSGIRGKDEEVGMFRVLWEMEDTMITRIGNPSGRGVDTTKWSMTLRYQGKSYLLDEMNRRVTIGREDGCTIVMKGNYTSRQHAIIECSHGKFTLTDQSSNGTFVRFEAGHVVHLQSESIILHGSGSIVVGNDPAVDVLEFAICA